jgi:hypothetical protein
MVMSVCAGSVGVWVCGELLPWRRTPFPSCLRWTQQCSRLLVAVLMLRVLFCFGVAPTSIFARWEHKIGMSYSSLSLIKFVTGMVMAAHWVRPSSATPPPRLSPILFGWVRVSVSTLLFWAVVGFFKDVPPLPLCFRTVHGVWCVQLACLWRVVVDLEGDAFSEKDVSWVQCKLGAM